MSNSSWRKLEGEYTAQMWERYIIYSNGDWTFFHNNAALMMSLSNRKIRMKRWQHVPTYCTCAQEAEFRSEQFSEIIGLSTQYNLLHQLCAVNF